MNNDAYNQGFSAYADGFDTNDNPYSPGSDNWIAWSDGWHDAEHADEAGQLWGEEEEDNYSKYEEWI